MRMHTATCSLPTQAHLIGKAHRSDMEQRMPAVGSAEGAVKPPGTEPATDIWQLC